MWKEMCVLDPECSKFCWPERGPEAEKRSFMLQAEKAIFRNAPDYESVFPLMTRYKRFDLPDWLEVHDDDKMEKRIRALLGYVNRDSSPGVPYASLSLTNGGLIDKYGDQIVDVTCDRIRRILQVDAETLKSMSSKELVEKGLVDPIRVFIKDEPHKREKVMEGRNRLIMSVSIVDKLITMYMRKHMHDLEILNWEQIPNKPGISFDRKGTRSVYGRVIGSLNRSSDVSGFDWSYQEWYKEMECKFKIYLTNNPSDYWKDLMIKHTIILSNCIYQLSDGTLLALLIKGIMNSGEYGTSNINSTARNLLAKIVGSSDSDAMGDDCLENYVDNVHEKYWDRCGLKVKVYDEIKDSFEFCSRFYSAEGSYLVNYQKILMNLIHSDVTSPYKYMQIMRSFEDDLQDHPNFTSFFDNLEKVGFLRPDWRAEELVWTEGPN